TEGLQHVDFVIVHGQQHDVRIRGSLEDLPCRLDAVKQGHAEIQQDDGGGRLFHQANGLMTIACLSHYLEAFTLKQCNQTLTKQGMVIGDHHALTCALVHSGISIFNSVPSPGADLITKLPWSESRRS